MVAVNDIVLPLLVDTGAPYTCVNPKSLPNLAPHKSGKFAKTIGFGGKVQMLPFSFPLNIQIGPYKITMPILLSSTTPVNILGRDVLCRLGLKIECTPQGLSVEKPSGQMSVVQDCHDQTYVPQVTRIIWLSCVDNLG